MNQLTSDAQTTNEEQSKLTGSHNVADKQNYQNQTIQPAINKNRNSSISSSSRRSSRIRSYYDPDPEVLFCSRSLQSESKGQSEALIVNTMSTYLEKILNSPPLNCEKIKLDHNPNLLSKSFLEQQIILPLVQGNPHLNQKEILSSKTLYCVKNLYRKFKSLYFMILLMMSILIVLVNAAWLYSLMYVLDSELYSYIVFIIQLLYNSITLILNWLVFRCNLRWIKLGNFFSLFGMFINFITLPIVLMNVQQESSEEKSKTIIIYFVIGSLNIIVFTSLIPFSFRLTQNLKKLLAVTKQIPDSVLFD